MFWLHRVSDRFTTRFAVKWFVKQDTTWGVSWLTSDWFVLVIQFLSRNLVNWLNNSNHFSRGWKLKAQQVLTTRLRSSYARASVPTLKNISTIFCSLAKKFSMTLKTCSSKVWVSFSQLMIVWTTKMENVKVNSNNTVSDQLVIKKATKVNETLEFRIFKAACLSRMRRSRL